MYIIFTTHCFQDSDVRQERLYFFQFPTPFPTFKPNKQPVPTDPSAADKGKGKAVESPKRVTFADEATSKDPPTAEKPGEDSRIDGIIGQMEIYKSGAVKMRLANGILMDVRMILSNLPNLQYLK